MLARLLTVTVLAAQLGACSVLEQLPARGSTAWDPKPGYSLIDQIPNNTASDVCAGHIRPELRLPHQSDRC